MTKKKPVKKPKGNAAAVSKKVVKQLAKLARQGAFGTPQAKGKKKASKRKPSVAKRAKKLLKDMVINGDAPTSQKPRPNSRIFQGEMADRMTDLFGRGGLEGMARSHKRLPVSDVNSPFAVPNGGDTAFFPGAGLDSGLSFQGSRAGKPTDVDYKTGKRVPYKVTAAKEGDGLSITAANVSNVTPMFHTPGNAQDAYNLPKSYVEQCRWSRLLPHEHVHPGHPRTVGDPVHGRRGVQ